VALDPRTPVLVGVGQVTNRPDPATDLDARPSPVDLMVQALRGAAEDAAGSAPGAPAGSGDRLLAGAGSLRIVASLGRGWANPALAVAEHLGIAPRQLMVSTVGGNTPQSFLHDSARAIASGDAEVILVAGAEALYTSGTARKSGTPLGWGSQDSDSTSAPELFGENREPLEAAELERGLALPIQIYPLFENALRAKHGWSIAEHRQKIGALWSSFSAVAAANSYAWLPESLSPAAIVDPGPSNRMVSFPYTKLCCANLSVDQGAAYIVCSVDAARAAGVAPERWIFPLAGADAHDHWFISERASLAESPAIAIAGRAALDAAGIGIDDVALVDLYSCFPSVVTMAAGALGLALDDPARPLTLTGGLTFFGGPGNNYTTHGIAAMVGGLRDAPGSIAMTTGLGWFATKHAVGLYSSAPPKTQGFVWRQVQADVDALPRTRLDADARGPVTVETYTVLFDRTGPERAVAACRTPQGSRTWADVHDLGELDDLCEREGIGRHGVVGSDRILRLS